ncbi:Chromatin-associated protein SWI6 [Pseudolycoriella hygida]|uniref:Chromatin-associated protein SWI6 n=1 Tax=Pseudolycoriella hygida TaxID=35572 RepID=A0A9Q0S170_9DIPT|nr:Chromatin-associated protein SWI6 [Pseudolycoriella hygida]
MSVRRSNRSSESKRKNYKEAKDSDDDSSDSNSDKANDKRRKRKESESYKESHEESSDESSDDEPLVSESKRKKGSSKVKGPLDPTKKALRCCDHLSNTRPAVWPKEWPKKVSKKKKKKPYKDRISDKNQIEAILTHRFYDGKRCRSFLVKWKDDTRPISWCKSMKVMANAVDLYRKYMQERAKEYEVEAILSHERTHTIGVYNYHIKWKDPSKPNVWMRHALAAKMCPDVLVKYNDGVAKKESIQLEVERIIRHKFTDTKTTKFLIEWKDESKKKSWHTTYETVVLCPDLLDRYARKHRDVSKRLKIPVRYKEYAQQVHENIQKFHEESEEEDSDYEVERILDVRSEENKSREFLIRWKDYETKYDSWEPEENLSCVDLIKKFLAKQLSEK